ncbi:MAG: hypothetical protein IJ794_16115 [Lachnospiraceae bacterium]|nr:hypothetical protein [Lachnospiraceae bacterium]
MSISPLNFNYNQYRPITSPQDGRTDTGFGVSSTEDTKKLPGMPGDDDKIKGEQECETCKKRKYQDGSDEMVSFKTAQHISPESAGARVRAHEQEHVSNAYTEAAQKGGKVIRASVAIHTAICPECGRSYVSGGLTTTQIKYSNEENPYQKDKKARDYGKVAGSNAKYDV